MKQEEADELLDAFTRHLLFGIMVCDNDIRVFNSKRLDVKCEDEDGNESSLLVEMLAKVMEKDEQIAQSIVKAIGKYNRIKKASLYGNISNAGPNS